VKQTFLPLLLLALMLAWASSPALTHAEDWPDPFAMEFEPVEVTPVEPVSVTLDNGMTLFLLEDRSLPLIEGTAYIRAGANHEPEERIGLAQLTALLSRDGGAGDRSPEEVDRQLEYLAASVEMSASEPFATAGFSSLEHNVDEVLEVLADILRRPAFDARRMEIARGRLLESIRRRNDQPLQLAVREFIARVSEGHPSGRYSSIETMNAIEAADIREFHERFYRPNNIVMALSGDFNAEEMADRIEEYFGCWEARPWDAPELPPFDEFPEPVVYHVQRDLAQSIIFVGHPAVTFDDPDYIRLDVLNRILGGAGDNRLFEEVRTRRGYAYAVGSQVTQGFEYPGIFFAYSVSRVDKTAEVLELMRREIKQIVQEPVSEAELDRNRRAIVNRAAFRYASAKAVADRSALVNFLGVDPDYYARHMEIIEGLTIDELLDTAQKHLRPEDAVILVVGNEELFDRDLTEFGPVEAVELD